ncbi:hypothetical protein SO802_015704 [Lithocarpus litseifolius]|uniref:Uncharacterized protein n=1 Tax=Lithocarpus litseifolius TaxID=425828 RepID=A0AAW2CUF2_9ROSI
MKPEMRSALAIRPDRAASNKDFPGIEVSENMPLYVLLNEFQQGHCHMAVVVGEHSNHIEHPSTENPTDVREVRVDIHVERHPQEKSLKSKRALKKLKSLSMNRGLSKTKSKKWSKDFHLEVLHINDEPLPNFSKEGEASYWYHNTRRCH